MISRRIRSAAALFFVVVWAAAAAGCGSTTSDAATITYNDATGKHTIHVSKSDLLNQVKQLQDTKQFRNVLLQAQPPLADAKGDDTAHAGLTSKWLAQLVDQAVIDAQFKSQGLQVTDTDRTAATNDLRQRFTADAYNAFPKSLKDTLLTGDARLNAVLSSCPSGRLVADIIVKNAKDADSVYEQLKAAPADFAKLAQKYSIDTTSKQSGGLVGCLYPGQFPPEMQAAAENIPTGVATIPIKVPVQGGTDYAIVYVQPWDPQAVASNPTLGQSAQQAASATLNKRLGDIHVWVNPQFGTWSAVPSQSGGTTYTVVPPTAPTPRDQREKPPVDTTPTT